LDDSETAKTGIPVVIERSRRGESAVEEALGWMYLAGVSVPRVEEMTKTL
jgi:hypothetical protein